MHDIVGEAARDRRLVAVYLIPQNWASQPLFYLPFQSMAVERHNTALPDESIASGSE